MAATDVREFFDEYVLGFMCADVERELRLARSKQNAGNFLAALGLLVYTEALGRVERANFPRVAGDQRSDWCLFFDSLGAGLYRTWREGWESRTRLRVENLLRNGMTHEYLPKRPTRIIMLGDALPAVGQDDEPIGPMFLFVEAYHRDFRVAAEHLRDRLLSLSNPVIPTPR